MADTEQTDAPDYVTLVSNDGFEFLVQRKSACLSGAIKRMLDPNSTFAFFFFCALPMLTPACRWLCRIKDSQVHFREHQRHGAREGVRVLLLQ
jgi:hypothetical protein